MTSEDSDRGGKLGVRVSEITDLLSYKRLGAERRGVRSRDCEAKLCKNGGGAGGVFAR